MTVPPTIDLVKSGPIDRKPAELIVRPDRLDVRRIIGSGHGEGELLAQAQKQPRSDMWIVSVGISHGRAKTTATVVGAEGARVVLALAYPAIRRTISEQPAQAEPAARRRRS